MSPEPWNARATPSDAADLAAARAQVKRLTSALEQIQELATDTPTSEDAEEALDDIAELCESTLAQSSAGEVE